MGLKIKICGLRREEDIAYVNEVLPEYAGFVFAKKSRRYVTDDLACHLSRMLAPEIRPVGVFVNEMPERVAELLEQNIISMAQLHGQEDAVYIRKLRMLTKKPLIQAFAVESEEDVRKAEASEADYILLDHGKGGSGACFDWSLLDTVRRPFFLAGGLNAENVRPDNLPAGTWAVDVSSGVETEGRKDLQKIRQFVNRVRGTHFCS